MSKAKSSREGEEHPVQKTDQQRTIEMMMAYLLTCGVGYGLSLFGDLLELYPLENGTFSVCETIMLTRWGDEGREEIKEEEIRKILAAATGSLSFFENRHQTKAEIKTEVIFSFADDAVSFFERRRQERQLGYDFETDGASIEGRQNIRDQPT